MTAVRLVQLVAEQIVLRRPSHCWPTVQENVNVLETAIISGVAGPLVSEAVE